MPSLPSSFTSLYRLFLRTTSTAVLHQSRAKRNLRQLWRPAFVDAARVVKQLQDETTSQPTRQELENWLKTWEQRVDNTLSLLYTSSISRGLPHQVTRNLSQLVSFEFQRLSARRYPVWNPRLPLDAREYQIPQLTKKDINKEEKSRRIKYVGDRSWNALSQVVGMAEGGNGISLGRVVVHGKIWQTSSA